MKKVIIVLTILMCCTITAQDKYLTRSGEISFEASVPSFEEVAAKNQSATAILDTSNGEIASLVLIKGFRFKNALMEEHFNENYAESNKFPKATFKGSIEDFDMDQLTETTTTYIIEGTVEFHGQSKKCKDISVMISKSADGSIDLKGNFNLKASDFDIEIPSVVRNKIAEDIEVGFNFKLKKK